MNNYLYFLHRTSYFVLGLTAKTASGVEILEELKWECVYNTYTGVGTGLCIPIDSQAFLSVSIYNLNMMDLLITCFAFKFSSFLNGHTQDLNQLLL